MASFKGRSEGPTVASLSRVSFKGGPEGPTAAQLTTVSLNGGPDVGGLRDSVELVTVKGQYQRQPRPRAP